MGVLSVLDKRTDKNVFIRCADIDLTSTLRGETLTFLVYEDDAVMLKKRFNKIEVYSYNAGPPFRAELTSLEVSGIHSVLEHIILSGVFTIHNDPAVIA